MKQAGCSSIVQGAGSGGRHYFLTIQEETEPPCLDHVLQFGLPLAVWGEEMSQFYAKAEDEERCLQSSITRRPIMMVGVTTEGKVASFGGIVQSVENGHREYPGYPVRVTMK